MKINLNYIMMIGLLICLIIATGCARQEKSIESLQREIVALLAEEEGDFAVAFKDLSNADNLLLINEKERFHAASTMKTPVMIELFKQAGIGRFSLKDSILLINEFKSIVDGSLYKMDITEDSSEATYDWIGNQVMIEDLMRVMITHSSNLATNVLIQLVDAKNVTNTMRDLGAPDIEVLRGVEDIKAYESGLSNTTTAYDLMAIMEAIATFEAGSEADCNSMIDILTDQHFNDMIPMYLPKNVKVAHKTGSITGVHHDSGIVYLPDGRSYVLVMLSKNLKDFDGGTRQLAKVSKLIFDHLQN